MRENRTYGSEGGETPQGVFPTLILSLVRSARFIRYRYKLSPVGTAYTYVILSTLKFDLNAVVIDDPYPSH